MIPRVTKLAVLLALTASACANLTDASIFSALDEAPATLTTDKSDYLIGETIGIDFSGMSGSETDWLALAHPGDADEQYILYSYTGGGTDGHYAFVPPAIPAGTYEVRAYFAWTPNEDYIVRARSATFTVHSGVSISTPNQRFSSAEPVVVDFSGLAGTATDWVAIASPGSEMTSFVRWVYTSGSASGEVTFVNVPAGTWVARVFAHDDFDLGAESAPFTVGGAVTMSSDQYSAGGTITVNWNGIPDDATNWIALTAAGSDAETYLQWHYVSGSSGQVQFAGLPAGDYEARVYLHDTFVVDGLASFSVMAANPVSVTTSKDSYTTGEAITASYAGTSAADWVAVAAAGSPDTSFLYWSYVDDAGSVTFGTLPVGDYVVRVYSNDSYNVAATHAFTVAGAAVTTAATTPASDPVAVDFSGLPGYAGDWIGISAVGSGDDSYVTYAYTGGVHEGQVTFAGLAPGDYEARAYVNDTFEVIARTAFSVTP